MVFAFFEDEETSDKAARELEAWAQRTRQIDLDAMHGRGEAGADPVAATLARLGGQTKVHEVDGIEAAEG